MTAFIQAHLQLLAEGRVPDAVAHARLTICTGNDENGRAVDRCCEYYRDEQNGWGSGHCRACGCPDWPISRMHRPRSLEPGKAWFPMGCPAGKYAYHPGRRLNNGRP